MASPVAAVDTVSGRVIIRNPDVAQVAGSPTLTELWRVGSLDGTSPDVFGDIWSVELDRDGSLYVLDAQASEVRVFGPNGAFQRRIGGPGEGPGELNRPAGMALDNEGILWVLNWGNGRYTGYDPSSGSVHLEVRRRITFASFPWPGRFDQSGVLVEVGLDASRQPAIVRLDAAFAPADTLAMPRESEEHRVTFRRGGTPVMTMRDPFSPRPFWAPGRNGIVVGEGAAYRLHRVTFAGDTTHSIEISRPPIPVTPQDRDSALARYREMAESSGGTPDRAARVADVKPAHGSLFVDDVDRIWIRAETDRVPAWDIISSDGFFIGQLEVPEPPAFAQPSVRNGRLALVSQLGGVPTVVVYSLPEWLE